MTAATSTPPGAVPSGRRTLIAAALLLAAVLGLYAQVLDHSFVGFDDEEYFTQNEHVHRGLTWAGIKWAFTEPHLVYWHPVTTLSLMLDCSLWGVDAGKIAFENALLHGINAGLLCLLLTRLTGSSWTSIAASVLFALHPLRVESVAWAAERKDVLSGLFFLLALLAYHAHAVRPRRRLYLGLCLLCALGMMAKPMLVSLPCVFLLMDVWPLGRWLPGTSGSGAVFGRLLLEKVPLFLLSAGVSLVTLFNEATSQAHEPLSLAIRSSTVPLAYAGYLTKALWPVDLLFFYPHPAIESPDTYVPWNGATLAASAVLVSLSGAALALLRTAPFLAVGWFWWLGMLFPVTGFSQYGVQLMADRFTYLPMIGLLIALCWLVRSWTLRWPGLRPAVILGTVGLAGIYGVASWRQIGLWKDGETLYRDALRITPDNFVAHSNLATLYMNRAEPARAEEHLRAALAIRPDLHVARNNLGLILARRDQLEEACAEFEGALCAEPGFAEAHNNLAVTLVRLGRDVQAAEHYRRALENGPRSPSIVHNLALLLATSPDPAARDGAAAVRLAEEALLGNPGSARYRETLAAALAESGDFEGAVREQRAALGVLGEDPKAAARLALYERREPYRR